VEHWSNDTDRIKTEYTQKPVPQPHCSPQIPHSVLESNPGLHDVRQLMTNNSAHTDTP